MDFWGYPSDSCLFVDNLQNPVTDIGNKNQQKKTRHLIFYILVVFLFYLISASITCYKYRNKIQEIKQQELIFLMSQCKYRDKP